MIDYKGILGKYLDDYERRPTANFSDITANLLASAHVLSKRGRTAESDNYIEHVRQYLKLLDDFPEFRMHELTHDDPRDITSLEYIEGKFQELRKRSFK